MAMAQNLVPNPSFEEQANCGMVSFSQIETAPPWYTPTTATPDVYDLDTISPCGYNYDSSIEAIYGSIAPVSGTRVAGGIMYEPGDDAKDYIAVRLDTELTAGFLYTVSMRYRLAAPCQFAIDQLGVLFSPDSLSFGYWHTIDQAPSAIFSTGAPLANTTSWEILQSDYFANGSERYMILGSFQDSSQVSLTERPGHFDQATYYFLDDIDVQLKVVTAVENPHLNVSPGPSGGLIIGWNGRIPITHALLLDATGRSIQEFNARMDAGSTRLEGAMDSEVLGFYMLIGWTTEGRYTTRFFKE